ncbi:hypothetical protein PR003_g8945 [Phytophthora rubi]|uniref:Secreted protein n=1 Tax=Phytophthora rubi TaxID=129364 RepID=A0A6A4FFN8_9STRA|nr:hypothetical protein PR002_g8724 [Phytophthora rubi]KAE9038298.1 hypothetical protein PR001_g8002 [Phytophthora rubi]KAE9343493.1 hypothetical protein PR003_g8945 [Phytophthora rubi]
MFHVLFCVTLRATPAMSLCAPPPLTGHRKQTAYLASSLHPFSVKNANGPVKILCFCRHRFTRRV